MKTWTFTAMVLCSTFLCQLTAAEPKAHPDLVIFLADDLSARDLPLYGGTNIQTPAISQLASEGMTFTRAFVASPSCAPSRAALLTGLMPARNGAEENHSFPHEDILRLPRILQKHGYQTAAFGKVAHQKSAISYGFETISPGKDIPQVRKNVRKFLEGRNDRRPLALFVGVSDPHVPWPSESTVVPKNMLLPTKLLDTPQTRIQRSRYLQEVKNLDSYLGELLNLATRYLSEDRIILFSSDHGAQFPFGKWTLYDEGTRVPLVVKWKGRIKPGTRSDAMVSWIDVLPTLIDIVGGEVPENIDGRSFADVLRGNRTSHRERIFTTHSGDRKMNVYPIRSVRTDQYKLIWNPHPDFAFTTHIDLLLRETSGDYFKEWLTLAKTNSDAARIVNAHHGRPEFELFDLDQDPQEQTNLASKASHTAIKNNLLQDLNEWLKTQNDKITVFHEPLMLDEPKSWVPRK